jgi:hypothetical protein
MNHIAHSDDVAGYKNLYASIIIQTFQDLEIPPRNYQQKYFGTADWIAELVWGLYQMKCSDDPRLTGQLIVTPVDAVRLWAVSALALYGLPEDFDPAKKINDRFTEDAIRFNWYRRQVAINLGIKRFLDKAFGLGDAHLTAMVVMENVGLISDQALDAGLERNVADTVEKQVRQKAEPLMRQAMKWLAQPPLRRNLKIDRLQAKILQLQKDDVT